METLSFFYLCSSFTSFKVSFLFGDLTVEFINIPSCLDGQAQEGALQRDRAV